MKSLDISVTLGFVVSALAEECAKLDPVEEKATAEGFLLGETKWPAYEHLGAPRPRAAFRRLERDRLTSQLGP